MNAVLVGAPEDDGPVTNTGSAYVFRFDGARWLQEAKLTPAAPHLEADRLGEFVLLVDDIAAVGAPDFGIGSAFVFMLEAGGGAWTQAARLIPSESGPAEFGSSIAVSGDVALVGDFQGGNSFGEVFVFRGLSDCNANAIMDLCEVAGGGSPDFDGDGLPDECDADCNENGIADERDIAGGTSQDCNGNAMPDECEAADCNANDIPDGCDLASGPSTDFDGNGVPDECGAPPNDACGAAGPVGEGSFVFNTLFSTTDGLIAACGPFVQDVWYLYTPSCTGFATFSLCNAAGYDTQLAVSPAGPCPPLNPGTCNDDAPGCGQTSQWQMVVVAGLPYLVRVGGTAGGGTGMLTISCVPFTE